MALASPCTSAHVIPFPGAAAAPVVNPKRRLRYSTTDKNVSNIKRGLTLRMWQRNTECAAASPAAMTWPLPPANPATWPFGFVRRDQFETLSATDRAEIEGYILGRVISRQEARHV